jgi:hypothetical protein
MLSARSSPAGLEATEAIVARSRLSDTIGGAMLKKRA